MHRLIYVFAGRNGLFVVFFHAAVHVYIAAESPSVESESNCGSRGRWFEAVVRCLTY